jgi:hypothetical protein
LVIGMRKYGMEPNLGTCTFLFCLMPFPRLGSLKMHVVTRVAGTTDVRETWNESSGFKRYFAVEKLTRENACIEG